jgi:hypothetical protein
MPIAMVQRSIRGQTTSRLRQLTSHLHRTPPTAFEAKRHRPRPRSGATPGPVSPGSTPSPRPRASSGRAASPGAGPMMGWRRARGSWRVVVSQLPAGGRRLVGRQLAVGGRRMVGSPLAVGGWRVVGRQLAVGGWRVVGSPLGVGGLRVVGRVRGGSVGGLGVGGLAVGSVGGGDGRMTSRRWPILCWTRTLIQLRWRGRFCWTS